MDSWARWGCPRSSESGSPILLHQEPACYIPAMVTQELPEEGQRDPPHALLKVKSVTCCRAGKRRAYATSWTGPKESDLVSRLASCSLKCDFLPPHTATQHSVDTLAPPLPEHASRKACECVPTTSAPLSGPGPCSCSHGSGFSTPPRQQRKAPEFRLPPHVWMGAPA